MKWNQSNFCLLLVVQIDEFWQSQMFLKKNVTFVIASVFLFWSKLWNPFILKDLNVSITSG